MAAITFCWNYVYCRAVLAWAITGLLLATACTRQGADRIVVLYSSVDESYAREIAKRFELKTGIAVKLVSDTEATKSTGLLNRLLAERERPVADVFWSGDVIRAAVLKRHGLSQPYAAATAAELPLNFSDPDHHYTSSSGRLRVIIYHTERAGVALPESVLDLAKPEFAPRTCLANPLFGTSSMHAAALFETLGEEAAARFFTSFRARGGRMLASNGEVKRRVAAGEFAFGLTDSDDVSVAMGDGKPVRFIIPDQSGGGAVLIPSAVVLINDAPHPEPARRLVDFLVSAEVEQAMAASPAAHFPLRPGMAPPAVFGKGIGQIRVMPLDYQRVAARLEALQSGFLKTWVEAQW